MPAKPLNEEQKADAARLRAIFDARQEEDKDLTQESLAFACGWNSQGTVHQYLKPKIPLNVPALLKFARELGVTPQEISPQLSKQLAHLMLTNAQPATVPGEQQAAPGVQRSSASAIPVTIPVISTVQAARLRGSEQPYPADVGHDVVFVKAGQYSPWAFALEIDNLSMAPEFQLGDLVIIDPAVKPAPGECVVAKHAADSATFKKYRPRRYDAEGNEIFELVPINPDYPVFQSDVDHLELIGTLVEHRKSRKMTPDQPARVVTPLEPVKTKRKKK